MGCSCVSADTGRMRVAPVHTITVARREALPACNTMTTPAYERAAEALDAALQKTLTTAQGQPTNAAAARTESHHATGGPGQQRADGSHFTAAHTGVDQYQPTVPTPTAFSPHTHAGQDTDTLPAAATPSQATSYILQYANKTYGDPREPAQPPQAASNADSTRERLQHTRTVVIDEYTLATGLNMTQP